MTNADKYLKDGVDITKFASELSYYYEEDKDINKFPFRNIMKFLNEEIKPILTEDERVILRNIEYGYKYIYRHCSYLYIKSFEKGCFDTNKVNMERKFDMYDHLFQFIKEGEEYNIQELLGDEE